jgi:hypothetical protein
LPLQLTPASQRSFEPVVLPQSVTDTNGRFSFEHLPPDSYRLSVNGFLQRNRQMPDAPLGYYPDTQDAAKARPITLDVTRSTRGLKMTLPRDVQLVTVRGVIKDAQGRGRGDVRPQLVGFGQIPVGRDGSFVLSLIGGVPHTIYVGNLLPNGAPAGFASETTTFVASPDMNPLVITLKAADVSPTPEP